MSVQCIYGQDFHEMRARLRGLKKLLTLYQILNKTWFPLADEIAEPRPDMNSIKVATFTVSEKSTWRFLHPEYVHAHRYSKNPNWI